MKFRTFERIVTVVLTIIAVGLFSLLVFAAVILSMYATGKI